MCQFQRANQDAAQSRQIHQNLDAAKDESADCMANAQVFGFPPESPQTPAGEDECGHTQRQTENGNQAQAAHLQEITA